MRVCPKCGHHDPWYWRGSGVAVGLEFCRFDDFRQDYPELANMLVQAKQKYGAKNFVFDENYCYHLTRGMNVERQSLIENPQPDRTWHIPREAPPTKHPSSFGVNPHHHGKKRDMRIFVPDRFQRKLLEEKQT